jgi:membrane fusion protein, multidrug efflux system
VIVKVPGKFIAKIIICCAVSAVLLSACGGKQDAGPQKAPTIGVVVVPVAREAWSDVIEALGTAQANESVTITAKVTETVGRVNFSDGDVAERGQVLVELTGRAEVAALEEARAAWKEAQQQYDRQKGLVDQGTIARSQLDAQVALRDAALARMEAIRARLSDRVITAPFAGVLGFRRVSSGTLVTPGTEIVTLDDIETIKLDFSVPELSLGALRRGLGIRARSAAFPDREFTGEIVSLGSRVDPVTRAITVRAAIANADGALRPGMLLSVSVDSTRREALVVPEIAIVGIGAKHFVYVVGDDSTARRIEVTLGARRAGEVEIVQGVTEGQSVVTDGIVKLREGTRVATRAPAPETPASDPPAAGAAAQPGR